MRAHDPAAVGERRVGDGHLQRRGLQVALADREVDVVADGPGPGVRDPARGHVLLRATAQLLPADARAPGAVGDQALDLAGEVDARRRPEPEPRAQRLDDLAGQRIGVAAERVEEDVGGDLERLDEADRAVAAPCPRC